MKYLIIVSLSLCCSLALQAQKLPIGWEELTASDFPAAVKQSQGVCIVPMGVLEKHGPHLPLGTDVYTARDISRRAAEKEYCIVYPYYFVGQIFEAQHQPGTIAYSADLVYKMLDETCKEISRNGIKKILLVNTHGGNNAFLQYFCQTQLATPRDYAVYAISPAADAETQARITKMKKSSAEGHAGEVESSAVMAIRPDLVKIERANDEPGEDLNRLALKSAYPSLQTGIWWYAKFPNHYAGDAKDANPALGELSLEGRSNQLIKLIQMIKADTTTLALQNKFYKESGEPVENHAANK